jgi:hypothetical protein
VYDFQGARELLAGDYAPVKTAEKACDAACVAGRDAKVESVLTRATLLTRNVGTATAKAESHFSGEVNAATYELNRAGKIWKVVKRLD